MPASGSLAPSVAFADSSAARLPLGPASRRVGDDDACKASQLRTRYGPVSRFAPLRTRPLDHARGRPYRGPGRLPGPDLPWLALLSCRSVTSCHSGTPSCHGCPSKWAHGESHPSTTTPGRLPALVPALRRPPETAGDPETATHRSVGRPGLRAKGQVRRHLPRREDGATGTGTGPRACGGLRSPAGLEHHNDRPGGPRPPPWQGEFAWRAHLGFPEELASEQDFFPSNV